MADQPAGERSEAPTPERLRKAREEGQIPQSQEVPSALMLAALLIVLALTGSSLCDWFSMQLRGALSASTITSNGPDALMGYITGCGWSAMGAMVPIMLAAVAVSVFGSALVSGWSISPKALAIRLDRLAPGQGFKSLISSKALVTLAISVVKVGLICLIAWHFLKDRTGELMNLRWTGPEVLLRSMGQLTMGLGARMVLAMLAVALADLLYQKWNYTRTMRMTRQQLKEERRQHEPSPEIRSRVRSIQFQMSRRRMLQDVPKADVIVVNPTHVAVALKYDSSSMEAPTVVAKGPDLLCEKIKEVARAHAIPIVERPELARALYGSVEVGQPVPEALFVAVAEVMAMIYRLRNRSAGSVRRAEN